MSIVEKNCSLAGVHDEIKVVRGDEFERLDFIKDLDEVLSVAWVEGD